MAFPYWNLRRLYNTPDDIEKIIPLTKRAIKNGAFAADSLANFQSQIDLIENKALLNDKKALQKMMRETEERGLKYLLAFYLKDGEALVELLENNSWNRPYRSSTRLFQQRSISLDIYNNKRWKQQVRKDGVLALWQSRGFPAHCQPIGDDDFQCE